MALLLYISWAGRNQPMKATQFRSPFELVNARGRRVFHFGPAHRGWSSCGSFARTLTAQVRISFESTMRSSGFGGSFSHRSSRPNRRRRSGRKRRSTDPLGHQDSLLFHRRRGIADSQTLKQETLNERADAAQPLILRSVRQLVNQEPSLPPIFRPDEYAIAQGQARSQRRVQLHRFQSRSQKRLCRQGDLAHPQ